MPLTPIPYCRRPQAIQAGYFHNHGLEIDWTTYNGGTGAMTKALREGELDVAVLLTEGIVADLHRGNPSKLLGTFVSTPLTWGVHVAASSKWQCSSELEQATYAVSRMGSGSRKLRMQTRTHRGQLPCVGGGCGTCLNITHSSHRPEAHTHACSHAACRSDGDGRRSTTRLAAGPPQV